MKDEIAREAWSSIFDLLFSDASHQRMHDASEAVGLTPGLMKALLSFEPGQAIAMKMLAQSWRCDASYVTSLVDGLEERGIVERRSHPTDRRSKTVGLTAEGERVRQVVVDRLHEPPPAFAALTTAELRTLRDLLAKVNRAGAAAPSATSVG
jgi:DNA-binding MarR family transcriptional regulator